MVRTAEGSVLYLYTKFEAESSVRSKIIRAPKGNLEIGSRDPGRANLRSFIVPTQKASVLHLYEISSG